MSIVSIAGVDLPEDVSLGLQFSVATLDENVNVERDQDGNLIVQSCWSSQKRAVSLSGRAKNACSARAVMSSPSRLRTVITKTRVPLSVSKRSRRCVRSLRLAGGNMPAKSVTGDERGGKSKARAGATKKKLNKQAIRDRLIVIRSIAGP